MRTTHSATARTGILHVPDELLREGFAQVPVLLLRIPGVSPAAKLVFSCLLWYHYKLGYYPGGYAMAEEFHIPRRSLIRYMQELEDAGLIRTEQPRRMRDPLNIHIAPPSAWSLVVPNWHHENATEVSGDSPAVENDASDGDSVVPNCHQHGAKLAPSRCQNAESTVPNWHCTNILDRDSGRETLATLTGLPRHTLAAYTALLRARMQQGWSRDACISWLDSQGVGESEAALIVEAAGGEQ